jgi:hypothetical protein
MFIEWYASAPATMQSFKLTFKSNKHPRSSDSSNLPLSNADTRSPPSRFSLTRRCTRLLTGLILVCLFLFFSRSKTTVPSWLQEQSLAEKHSLPPLYEEYHDYERHLPQHNLSLPFPEGRDAKFFWAANHVTGMNIGYTSFRPVLTPASFGMGQCHAGTCDECGAGSCNQTSVGPLFQDLNSPSSSPISFVFNNFTWERDALDYSTFNGKLIPSRIPLSAIISGTFPMNTIPTHTKAVLLCRPHNRVIISAQRRCPSCCLTGVLQESLP